MEGEKISLTELSNGLDDFELYFKILPPEITDFSKNYTPPPFLEMIRHKRLVSKSEMKKINSVPGFWVKWYYDQDVSMFDRVQSIIYILCINFILNIQDTIFLKNKKGTATQEYIR